MFKPLLVCLLAFPLAVQGQSSSSSSMIAPDSPAGGTISVQQSQAASGGFFSRGIFTPSVHDAPVGSLTASYVYQYAPDLVGADRSLMGWSATPEVNFTKYLGLQAEFTSLYMRSVYPGQNRLLMAAGPRFNFAPHSRFSPFAFGEGGEIRATRQLSDVSDWNPVATGGIGIDFKISRGISFQLIPGEYVGQVQDDNSWNHSFMTKAGITFNLYR